MGFHWYDYLLFAATLVVALGLGIYAAARDRKRNSVEEYLLAGRRLTAIPTGLSIAVSIISAILVLGTIAEVYTYGMQMWVSQTASSLGMLIALWMYVPLFYNIRIATLYEVGCMIAAVE